MNPAIVAVLLGLAQVQDAPQVHSTLDTAIITVGDQFHLAVSVTHAAGAHVRWPDSLDLTPFEVIARRPLLPTVEGDEVTTGLEITMTAFEIGEQELPGFAVVIEDSLTSDTVTTDAWLISVNSVGLDEGGDIRDLKGPLALPRNWLLLLPWVIGLAALAGLAVWLYRRWYRAGPPPVTLPPVPLLAAHEVAYEALDALERERLLDRGEIKHHYIKVSDIIRTYLEHRYQVEALEMATAEVLRDLAAVGLERGTMEVVRRFLATCDLVKFAKLTPAPEGCREIVPDARHIVDTTKAAAPGSADPSARDEAEVDRQPVGETTA